ncbi:hypothetical protein KIPB_000286 [Kipferlia bialata]|uniref:Uncharacterized protein n=1 Tax=Kipferlia bialata TaxID=797122 RepID=A0A9K3GEU6_9EUKA|nr:hypothetical protein KIPB_000286 [Kipferlia bialata]|eukprot:g286.t1
MYVYSTPQRIRVDPRHKGRPGDRPSINMLGTTRGTRGSQSARGYSSRHQSGGGLYATSEASRPYSARPSQRGIRGVGVGHSSTEGAEGVDIRPSTARPAGSSLTSMSLSLFGEEERGAQEERGVDLPSNMFGSSKRGDGGSGMYSSRVDAGREGEREGEGERPLVESARRLSVIESLTRSLTTDQEWGGEGEERGEGREGESRGSSWHDSGRPMEDRYRPDTARERGKEREPERRRNRSASVDQSLFRASGIYAGTRRRRNPVTFTARKRATRPGVLSLHTAQRARERLR